MERLELPSGEWVALRDVASLKSRDRDNVVSALSDTAKQGTAYVEISQAVIACMVSEWSFSWPVPALAPGMLGDLSIPDRESLEAAVMPALEVLFPAGKKDDPRDESSPPPASAD